MSELTRCNFCSYQDAIRRANEKGLKVTLMAENFGLGGLGEYVHPKDVDVKKLTPKEREKYHQAWYMELGTGCAC